MNRFRPNIYKNLILIFIILGSLYFINMGIRLVNEPQTESSETIKLGGSFSLIDQFNKQFNSIEKKKYKLIYFGYTYCPDVCPIDLMKLSRVLDKNEQILSFVLPIFVTLDPNRDKPLILSDYLSNFNKNIVGLTGTEEQIKGVLKNFKIYKRNHKVSKDDMDYLIDHTSLFYLLNEKDEFVKHFSRNNFENDFLKFYQDL